MKAQEFYEKLRKAGLTEHITSNSNPDYKEKFYQQIFAFAEEYKLQFQSELIQWFKDYDSDEVERIEKIIKSINEIYAVDINWEIKSHPTNLSNIMKVEDCRFIGTEKECLNFIKEHKV